MRFDATILLAGKSATGIPVPDAVVAQLGSGKRPAVVVTINGFSYRSTVASMRGEFMLPLSAERREAAGVAAGDEVEVELELDTAPRVVEVPVDLAAALERRSRREGRLREAGLQPPAGARSCGRGDEESRDTPAARRQEPREAARGTLAGAGDGLEALDDRCRAYLGAQRSGSTCTARPSASSRSRCEIASTSANRCS